MKIRLVTLALQCRQKREVLDFSRQISFYHGKMSAGKSTIARLIDYCLGAKDIERTTAIRRELVSVELTAEIGSNTVIFERTVEQTSNVQVTWTTEAGDAFSVLAPIDERPDAAPIWGEDVFTLSDLIFHFFEMPPPRVRRSSVDDNSPMIRLSFRDILWYCYLDQNKLDNSFYRLQEAFVQTKSRYAIRFVLGYYTERLEQLQTKLTNAISSRLGKIATANQIREFLQQFGFGSEGDILLTIQEVKRELENAQIEQNDVQSGYQTDTHFVDQLRTDLRQMSEELGREDQALADLHQRLGEIKSLKAELVTARHKLARTQAASTVLSGVRFESCPQCGTKVENFATPESNQCSLCGAAPRKADDSSATHTEVAKRDLESRLREVDETIIRSQRSVIRQERVLAELKQRKHSSDQRLQVELQQYDSVYVAKAKEAARRVATLEERLRGLEQYRCLPDAIKKIEEEASQLLADQDQLRRALQDERSTLVSANSLIQQLEETYLELLLAVGVPGVFPSDRVRINRTTWIPTILEGGQEDQTWDFYSAGSNGKKTLLNVCYALAVHLVATNNNRPLPSLLIIDHPMKCIATSPDVNRDIFEKFYRQLYSLIRGQLKGTQFILIDNDYFGPDGDDIEIIEQFLTPDDDEHPPLISYYRGP